jgi:alanine racemase
MSDISLKPVMSFKTEVIRVSDVDEHTCISYGRMFTTKRKSRIATLPVGYADGFSRMLTGKTSVLIGGHVAPVVGRICMDQCMADITDVPIDVSVGDEAVLFGTQKDNAISADDIAYSLGTINYEVLCMVAKRVPRYYYRNGKIVGTENYLV